MPVLDPSLAPRVPRGVMCRAAAFSLRHRVDGQSDGAGLADPAGQTLADRVRPDYPYRTGLDNVNGLADYGFSSAELRAIERDNALRLLPRWRA